MVEWKLHPKWNRRYRDFEDSTGCWRQWDSEAGSKTAIPRSNITSLAVPRTTPTLTGFQASDANCDSSDWPRAQSPPSSEQSSYLRWGLSSLFSTTSRRLAYPTEANSPTDSICQSVRPASEQSQSYLEEASAYDTAPETLSAAGDVNNDLENGLETSRDPERPGSMRRPSPSLEDTQSKGASRYELTTQTGSLRTASPAGEALSVRFSGAAERSTGLTSSHEDPEEDLATNLIPTLRLAQTDILSDDLSEIGGGAQLASTLPNPGRIRTRPSTRKPSMDPSVLATVSEHQASHPNLIKGNVGTGSVETLDSRYKRRLDPKKFFKLGKVFALLWHEPLGDNGTEFSMTGPTIKGKFGQRIYSSIRRMVVVLPQRECCWCLPISTYGGKATTKGGLDPSTHAIVFMRSARPTRLPSETGMTKTSLVVDPAHPEQKLDPLSRINFAKIYTVEHNVKVMEVGQIGKESIHLLDAYWRNQMQPDPD